jgi:phenylalanine-4-hydroxylase
MQNYTSEDLKVWRTLFERQQANLQSKVCNEYQVALENMSDVLHAHEIPNFSKIDEWFEDKTGWKIKVVPGLIPVDDFFELLANKMFCSSTWLRSMSQLDYLEEPDMFHDIFGHIPLLSNPVFSDFMQTFGTLGARLKHDQNAVRQLQRLYWYTIEFGMIQIQQPKIYGAGIISSFGETNRSMLHDVRKTPFEMDQILEKPFKTDEIQNEYICIDSFEQLFSSIQALNSERACQIG